MSIEAFREEVRSWLEVNCPASMRTPMPADEYPGGGRRAAFKNPETKLWMDRCAEKGYTAPTWPSEYGGAGLDASELRKIEETVDELVARLAGVCTPKNRPTKAA